MLEFDPQSYELLDAHTYTADLHAAYRRGELEWSLEYSFREHYDLSDIMSGTHTHTHTHIEPAHLFVIYTFANVLIAVIDATIIHTYMIQLLRSRN